MSQPDYAAKAAIAHALALAHRKAADALHPTSHRRVMLLRLADDQDRKAACYQQMIDIGQRIDRLDQGKGND